jgi:hypothetical protein
VPPPESDDWMQAAAKHSQQQFAGNVGRLDKQARRGNRMVGGCLMFFGTLALGLGILGLTRSFDGRVVGLVVGAGATIGAGWNIWRHRREPRPKKIDKRNDRPDAGLHRLPDPF